jgi:hypothetical protein
MTRRFVIACILAATGAVASVPACQPSRTVSSFVPRLHSLQVLAPPGGGTHTIEQGGSLVIEVELTMGVNVSGTMIETRLDETTLPSGVDLDIGQIFLIGLPNLAENESAMASYNLEADAEAVPGSYQVTIESLAEITVEGAMDSDTDVQSTTFTLVVVAPGTEPPAEGEGKGEGEGEDNGGGATASCRQFVEHYNALPCTTDTLTEEGSCSESIGEFCEDEDAFNACRIENTFCEGDELIQNLEDCFAICN